MNIPSAPRGGTQTKAGIYALLLKQAGAITSGESDVIANAANLAALIYHSLPQINWAGFYFLRGGDLVLGPFQGQVACVRIPLGRGVCGTAAAQRRTILVPNVHDFPGHIACDSASNSEIVVPIVQGDALLGVLDLDSPVTERFDDEDRAGLEALAAVFAAALQVRTEPGDQG